LREPLQEPWEEPLEEPLELQAEAQGQEQEQELYPLGEQTEPDSEAEEVEAEATEAAVEDWKELATLERGATGESFDEEGYKMDHVEGQPEGEDWEELKWSDGKEREQLPAMVLFQA
jgi:hypothetical protein